MIEELRKYDLRTESSQQTENCLWGIEARQTYFVKLEIIAKSDIKRSTAADHEPCNSCCVVLLLNGAE